MKKTSLTLVLSTGLIYLPSAFAESALSQQQLQQMLLEQQTIIEKQQRDIRELKQEMFLETSDVFENIAPEVEGDTFSHATGVKLPSIPSPVVVQPAMVSAAPANTAPRLTWSGYGVINYIQYDFFKNAQDDNPDRRSKTDIERLILEPQFKFSDKIIFSGEIEFEHGGTGAAVEYEPEEAGEFETEVEKGGEVLIEQANILFLNRPELNWRVGHMLVPFGMVNTWHRPADYFTVERSLMETSIVPSVWHATGIEALGRIGQWRYQAQLINGLDSSQFSAFGFVNAGQSSRLESSFADNLAVIGRVDYAFAPEFLIGGSIYHGNSADNRPKQNLDVSANVTLMEIHGNYRSGPWTVRGEYIHGTIQNSDKITEANNRTFNSGPLGISRTPVAKEAEGFFVAVGYDIQPLISNNTQTRTDIFVRYDQYDTMKAVEGIVEDDPRYERSATTIGFNHHLPEGIVFKGEYSKRQHEGTVGNRSDQIALSVGFDF